MDELVADVIVVGLGAMGSAVTLRLAERGINVIGVDRFHPPHQLGSTHGQTRVTRLAIGEGEQYVPFVRRSHELWREIERDTGSTLFHQVGGLVLGPTGDGFLERTRAAAARFGIEHRNLSHHELADAYPMINAPPETEAYFEPQAGYVLPEAAVEAQLRLASAAGARLLYGQTVGGWTATASGVTVTTQDSELRASELVLCVGAWIRQLVPETQDLFQIYQQQLHWFPVSRGYEALRDMPIYIWDLGGGDDPFAHMSGGFYGFPAIDGPDGGIKLATESFASTVDPDDRPDPGARDAASQFHERYLSKCFPWVGLEPLKSASCLYTSARGSRFLIDRHPAFANVMLVSPCSGHGFKHSAAIGEAVAQRIAGEISAIDLSPFAFSRHLPGE